MRSVLSVSLIQMESYPNWMTRNRARDKLMQCINNYDRSALCLFQLTASKSFARASASPLDIPHRSTRSFTAPLISPTFLVVVHSFQKNNRNRTTSVVRILVNHVMVSIFHGDWRNVLRISLSTLCLDSSYSSWSLNKPLGLRLPFVAVIRHAHLDEYHIL